MTADEAHIIDIDQLMLTDVDLHAPFRASARIEAEVRRALEGTELGTLEDGAHERVGVEVSRSVMEALRGRE